MSTVYGEHSRTVEATGKTIDEAVKAALKELGCSQDEVEVEVLEEPKSLLGIFGSRPARVRLTVKQPGPPVSERPEEPALPPPATAKAAPSVQEPDAGQPTPVAAAPLPATAEPLARAAAEALAELLAMMKLNCAVGIRGVDTEGTVTLDIKGPEVALCIGKHGETLDAIQLLAAILANRRSESKGRVVVDAENYRQRRVQMLENLARTHAKKAKESKQEVVLPNLKAYERRIIHLALLNEPGVSTYSEGHGSQRHLVISPVD